MLKVARAGTQEVAASAVEGLHIPPLFVAPSLLFPTELSYDWLFGISAQPMLIVDAACNSILRANVAAARLLGRSPTALVGSPLTAAFATASTPAVEASLSDVRATGNAKIVAVGAGARAARLTGALSLVRADRRSYVLVRLDSPADSGANSSPSVVEEAIENASVAFLVTDAQLHLEYANRAFLQMIETDSLGEVCRQPLARWLGLTAEDLAQMNEQMSARRAVSVLWLRLTPEHGAAFDVEASVVAVPHAEAACWGFSIRSRPRLS